MGKWGLVSSFFRQEGARLDSSPQHCRRSHHLTWQIRYQRVPVRPAPGGKATNQTNHHKPRTFDRVRLTPHPLSPARLSASAFGALRLQVVAARAAHHTTTPHTVTRLTRRDLPSNSNLALLLSPARAQASERSAAMTWNKAPAADAEAGGGGDTGHARLRELGYKQELKRDLSYVATLPLSLSLSRPFSPFSWLTLNRFARATAACRVLSNFAFSFSIISVLTGITTLYNTGLSFGGPATMTFGWFVAGAFTMTVGLSMAEICSSFPTSGGLYYWSARLSGKRWAPFASWITGWYNRYSFFY